MFGIKLFQHKSSFNSQNTKYANNSEYAKQHKQQFTYTKGKGIIYKNYIWIQTLCHIIKQTSLYSLYIIQSYCILEQSSGFKYEPEDNDDVWARIDPTKFKIPRLETNGTLFEGGLNPSVVTSEPSMMSPGPDSPATLALSKKFEGLRHSSSSSFGEGEQRMKVVKYYFISRAFATIITNNVFIWTFV